MRTGRKFKSLLLLCVTVVPVLYVFYNRVEHNGTKSRQLQGSSRNSVYDTLQKARGHRYESMVKDQPNGTKQSRNNKNKTTRSPKPVKSKPNPSKFPNDVKPQSHDVAQRQAGSKVTEVTLRPNLSEGYHGDMSQIHASRITKLRSSCARQTIDECLDVRKCNLTEFFYSKQYNFAYCKVPKSGSTFWMKLFLVLYNGERYMRLFNTWSRSDIHTRSKRLVYGPMKIYTNKIPTVVVSRNPYSRLFSAYTDKVFMPLFWNLFKTMDSVTVKESFWYNRTVDAFKKSNSPLPERLALYKDQLAAKGMLKKLFVSNKITPVCANNATFEDFLKFIIAEVKANRVLEPHWAPISNLCRPCMFNTQMIIKQESFNDDVGHTLKHFKVNTTGFQVLKKELFDRRIEHSIPGIVRVVHEKSLMPDKVPCISGKEIVRRLWKAFQIQGYISDKEQVPVDLLTEKLYKLKIVNKAMAAIKREPLSPEQRSNQRRAYLIKAYRDISPDIIKAIQEIFKADFQLFDYPLQPPV